MNDNKAMKYQDIAQYSEVIGAVTISGVELQLCDYVECLNGVWYAIAYLNTPTTMADGMDESGIMIRTIKSATEMRLAYVPEELLERALPMHNDLGQTRALIERLQTQLEKLNRVHKHAA